jgi:hypothetical protein
MIAAIEMKVRTKVDITISGHASGSSGALLRLANSHEIKKIRTEKATISNDKDTIRSRSVIFGLGDKNSLGQ